jgi:hypothetical protein
MAFTKIQPQQLQLPTFLSQSGHLTFSDLTTGVEVYINTNLEGDFDIVGKLTVSSDEVITSNASNTFGSTNKIVGGASKTITGANNVILNGRSNIAVSGDYNTLVNGQNVDFGASGQDLTVIGGNGFSIPDQVTGAVVLADRVSTPTNPTNDSLSIAFNSGVTFQTNNSGVAFEDPVIFEDYAHFRGSSESVFSNDVDILGDLSVTGNLTVTGDIVIGDITLDHGVGASLQRKVEMFTSKPADLPAYLNAAYSNTFGTDSVNVLSANEAVTGFLLVDSVADPDVAKLIFIADGFTGSIAFDNFQTS